MGIKIIFDPQTAIILSSGLLLFLTFKQEIDSVQLHPFSLVLSNCLCSALKFGVHLAAFFFFFFKSSEWVIEYLIPSSLMQRRT